MPTRAKQNTEYGPGALPPMKVPAGQMTPELEQQAYAAQAEYMQGRPDPGHRFDHLRGSGNPSPAAGMARQNLGGGGGGGMVKPIGFADAMNLSMNALEKSSGLKHANARDLLGMKQDHDYAIHRDNYGVARDRLDHDMGQDQFQNRFDVSKFNVGTDEEHTDPWDESKTKQIRKRPGTQIDSLTGNPIVDEYIRREAGMNTHRGPVVGRLQ